MKNQPTHPLFDESITWLNIQQMEDIRSGRIDKQQAEREANYNRQNEQTPSWLLKDKEEK